MMLMMLMMLTRGRLLCCFARPFLCPIGVPSYTERRKDGTSGVVCDCNRGRSGMASCDEFALFRCELRTCIRCFDRAVRSNDPRTILLARRSDLVVISRQCASCCFVCARVVMRK